MLNGFENQWLLFKNILKLNAHTQIFLFYRASYFNLNRTKYFMLQEFDVNLDLTGIFSLKKSSICSPGLNTLNTFWNINITEHQKHFYNGEFKTKFKFNKSDLFKFIKIVSK